MGYQTLLKPVTPNLILITDSQRLSRDRFFEVVSEALAGGVDAVLVREKQMDSARLLAFTSHLRELTSSHKAKLIIHTQADIAKAVSADGVHLASTDLAEIPSVREWLNNPDMTISASCHNEIELGFVQRFGADYAFLSPVFPTQSHPGEPHLGMETFRKMTGTTSLPVIALGGINAENRNQLEGFGVAVIGSIFDANDPKAAATELL